MLVPGGQNSFFLNIVRASQTDSFSFWKQALAKSSLRHVSAFCVNHTKRVESKYTFIYPAFDCVLFELRHAISKWLPEGPRPVLLSNLNIPRSATVH